MENISKRVVAYFVIACCFASSAAADKLNLICSGSYEYTGILGENVVTKASTIFTLDFDTQKYESRDGGAGFVLYHGGTFSAGDELISLSSIDGEHFEINRITGLFIFDPSGPFPNTSSNVVCKKSDEASF